MSSLPLPLLILHLLVPVLQSTPVIWPPSGGAVTPAPSYPPSPYQEPYSAYPHQLGPYHFESQKTPISKFSHEEPEAAALHPPHAPVAQYPEVVLPPHGHLVPHHPEVVSQPLPHFLHPQPHPVVAPKQEESEVVLPKFVQGIQISHIGDYGIHRDPKSFNALETLYYDNTPKCRTVYEYRSEEAEDTDCTTSYKQECSSSVCNCDYIQCPAVPCQPQYKEHCNISYKKHCFNKYTTEYREECTDSYHDLCTTITVTKFVDECTEERCSGYGYNRHCVPAQCTAVPVTKNIEKCTKVPKRSCRRIPVRKPANHCKTIPVKECAKIAEVAETCGQPVSSCPELEKCEASCLHQQECRSVPVTECKAARRLPFRVPIRICDE